MALTHHCIARFAGARDYAILGDDIAICDGDVSVRYRSCMDKLGVTINSSKSIVHNPEYPSVSSAEFAKRIFVDGMEVTPVPVKLLKQAAKHPSLMALLLKTLDLRGYRVAYCGVRGDGGRELSLNPFFG
jgi:hypothetical protein